jgi:formamidopyrimidine-DNA glycosylase
VPELPEAETIVRTLAPLIEGREIDGASFPGARVLRGPMPELSGRRIAGVRRHGKRVLLELDRGRLLFSLGMTGALLWNGRRGNYTRAVLTFGEGSLLFDDIRQFGHVRYLESDPEELGPDPLEIGEREFGRRLRARRTQVKRLLLDQSFVRGLGNIYADEALHRAGISPLARTERLSRRRIAGLHAAIQELLREAIERRGSSISDYVDARGERGGFQALHRVYGKAGEPCPACGGLVRRIVLAQRGTHYCPRCQRP